MTSLLPDGVLILDKPAGITSQDAVNRIRRLYGTRQVGHTGTLDPMATGVLVVLVGRAVKASEFAAAQRKRYLAGLRLGLTTDTEDTTGQILTVCDRLPAPEEVEKVCASFVGAGMQTPPMYSALKVGGKKLVDLARAGIQVERTPRPIEITSLTVTPEGDGEYLLDVACSKGTYIRTLCADIGSALGCGGAMSSLRRTENGAFSLAASHTLEEAEALSPAQRLSLLQPTESLFADLPVLSLSPFFARLALCGNELYLAKLGVSLPEGSLVRLSDAGGFFALAQVRAYPDGAAAKPVRLFRLG